MPVPDLVWFDCVGLVKITVVGIQIQSAAEALIGWWVGTEFVGQKVIPIHPLASSSSFLRRKKGAPPSYSK